MLHREAEVTMNGIWEILQIEPTDDEGIIKRAYASLARKYNPEEHPREFLRVREAYEAALAYARQSAGSEDERAGWMTAGPKGSEDEGAGWTTAGPKGSEDERAGWTTAGPKGSEDEGAGWTTAGPKGSGGQSGEGAADRGEGGETDSKDVPPQGFSWDFTEENPFREGEGIKRFRELYTSKRRRDRAAWSDYFLSEAFLEGYREKDFAELMLEVVREDPSAYPPSQEFQTELYIAYGLQGRKTEDGIQIQIDPAAVFAGIDVIREIAMMGPVVTRFKGNDPAIMAGFRDYRELLLLAMGSWDDKAMLRLGKIVDYYLPHHISDKPIRDSWQYELSQRHPKSLKLLTYFFSRRELPDRVCRVPWNHLHLESATMGRDKLWYGGLREAVIDRLGEKPKVNYMQFLQEIGENYYTASEGETPEERAKVDALFEREDMEQALQDETFVEKEVLPYWCTRKKGKYFIRKLREYYSAHRGAPFAKKVLEEIDLTMEYQLIQEKLQEDMQAPLRRGVFDFHERPWLRYYLNVAFHLAQGLHENWLLPKYLGWYMPYSPEWGKRLVDPGEGGFDAEHPIGLRFGENVLYIRFHPRHIEYLWGEEGSPLVPPFPGEELTKIADDGMFWLLVPIAAAGFEAHQGIYEELVRRLSVLPVEEKSIPVIADCITGRICRFAQDNVPVCTFYREKETEGRIRLFGCAVYGTGALAMYEEMEDQQILLPGGIYNAPSVESAVQMGQRLLQELLADKGLELYMELLPEQILVRNQWNTPSAIDGELVTKEAVEELFGKYFENQVNRLELVWGQRSLLFLNQKRQYACLYFDHQKQNWYALVSMPEVYAVVESGQEVYVPFGLGMLPNYLVHQNLNLIRSRLGDILGQSACDTPQPRGMMWSPQIYRFETRQRYRLAMRQFGGYLAEQARNQILDRFYIPQLPVSLSYVDMEGQETEKNTGEKDKATVQGALADYMAGRLGRLTLVWQYEAADQEGETVRYKRCLCLIREQDVHMMFYQDDRITGVEYLVADVKEYMDAEGKKYRKAVFQGRTLPGYLVHTDLIRIRDSLDLLIPQMGQQAVNMGGLGEFSYIKEKFFA